MFEEQKKRPDEKPPAKEVPAREELCPLLELGRVVATPGEISALGEAGETGERYLFRHERGDWGDLCAEDKAANDRALQDGLRVLSRYILPTGEIWIITEWDRSVTTLLLPSDY